MCIGEEEGVLSSKRVCVDDPARINDSDDDLNMVVGGLVQTRKGNVRGCRKDKGVDEVAEKTHAGRNG